MRFNVAVAGATGMVGREMLETLYARDFPINKVYALASRDSIGSEVNFGDDKLLKVEAIDNFDFSKADIALFALNSNLAAKYAPIAAKNNCIVIDNSSYFRMEKDVPLIVPEANLDALKDYKKRNIIANPNCSTIQMLVALKPIHDNFKIKRIVVSTYQSVSGMGKNAMDELFCQTRGIYVNEPPIKYKKEFTKQIAFNVIPHIDDFMSDGATKEEWKMEVETQKILCADIAVHANCARVPVFIGHSEYINIETVKPIDEKSAKDAWKNNDAIVVFDHRKDEGYTTQTEVAGEDAVYISRVRVDKTVPNGLSFWCVGDNLRKGAALNAVQIAEALIKEYL